MLTLFGIKNCDTVKKARKWLDEKGVVYQFHDFRADGLSTEQLSAFVNALGWEAVLNRRGTTWRKLPVADTASVDEASASALMLEHVALIKRPVWQKEDEYRLGFAAKDSEALEAWITS